ncbi:MAG: hypothetical protein M1839_005751 [Geoglossum umbratile]|nr:MAG: hypothetical protein M1839_005751 [Geoglossum umbratile]
MWIWAVIFSNPTSSKVRIPNLSPTESWSSVKLRVAAALGLPVDRCRFFHKGKILEDRMGTLFQCNIKSDEVLSVQELQDLPTADEDNDLGGMCTSAAAPRQDASSSPPETTGKGINEESNDLELLGQASVCGDCLGNPRRKCRECGCNICGSKDDDPENIVCDECEYYYHWVWPNSLSPLIANSTYRQQRCLDPPLTSLPEDDWYCPSCKNDTDHVIRPGHEPQKSRVRKARKGDSSKRWGRGMANVGHSKKCTIVGDSHRGPIPGIEVGQTWRFRKEAGEDGVHRPIVSGIAGSVNKGGAVSIVIAAGYPEDEDHGNWFMYTGSGGKDLKTKNRRTGEQTFDQELTKANLALAATCDSLVSKNGGVAKNWRNSKGIRVVRSDKLRKHHPQYAPELGNRYDGIYKIVRYFPEIGKSGFQVYRYEFRRDDPTPAPWTKQGKIRIQELGLEMIFPETYDHGSETTTKTNGILEANKIDDQEIYRDPSPTPSVLGKRKHLHNPFATLDTFTDFAVVITTRDDQKRKQHNNSIIPTMKSSAFTIPLVLQKLIDTDIIYTPSHERLWRSIMDRNPSNLRGFIAALERELNCPVCQDFVQKPVTNPCGHIACLACMKGSVEGFGPKCPNCRACLIDTKGGNGSNSEEKDPKVIEKMKKLWRTQVQVDEKLVEVVRFYNQDYGKEKDQ